jgi:cyclopropane fatty-acyl-phospholipid synthase-like methyltransferase
MRSTDWDKIADHYFEKIDSPFSSGAKNKIYSLIKKIKRAEKKTVLEIGCGTGTLIPFLAKKFRKVIATDISHKMVEIATEKANGFGNVTVKKMDSIQIHRLKQKFDIIVSVNSMLMPNIVKVNRILKKSRKLLKKKGVFIGIFPSMESLIYHKQIIYDQEYDKRHNSRKAKYATGRILPSQTCDFVYGFFENQGKQKHYYGFELDYRFKKAGFSKISIGKLKYKWEAIEYDPNPKRFIDGIYEQLWDWTVVAEK